MNQMKNKTMTQIEKKGKDKAEDKYREIRKREIFRTPLKYLTDSDLKKILN